MNLHEPRPAFERPPVVEVLLSVQFNTLMDLESHHLAAFFHEHRDEFAQWLDQPPIQPGMELFAGVPLPQPQMVRFESTDVPPLRRALFVTSDETELVQVQCDRLIRNWRKGSGQAEYPRYGHVRAKFEHDFVRFAEFAKGQGLGDVVPNQCEVTYVNHIPANDEASGASALEALLQPWSGEHSDDALPHPDAVEVVAHYPIVYDDRQRGRLHVVVERAVERATHAEIFRMVLTARGYPLGKGLEGVLGFFDLGREYVVRGFASVTRDSMHGKWGRRDGS
jgi:uncharacterized protein (TIGR04255 family)